MIVIFRSLVVAGFVLGVAWIVLPFGAYVYELTLQPASKRLAETRRQREREQAESAERRADQEQRAQEQEERKREASERERERKQAEHEAHRRREDARLGCELLYSQHAVELAERFPQERFDAFVRTYLTDNQPPEYVEQRAELLKEQIHEAVKATQSGAGRFSSLSEIAECFAERRREIEALGYDEQTKESFVTEINDQESEAIRRFLQQ